MRIGFIIGSLSAQSINRRLLHGLQEVIGNRAELVELRIDELPLYNRDLDGRFPESAINFKRLLKEVDGLIIATPEYNRSMPAALKNALEWGSRPGGQNAFPGIPVGIIGASTGRLGTALSQHQLREVLAYLDMPTLGQPEFYHTFDAAHFDSETGAVSDTNLYRRLGDWATTFFDHVEKHPRGTERS
ncbi:NAD(P)H-dependent oxidoreductase [Leucobacter coleopterorum]|uniref:NAD(P)H-dependent oxidoreductase n=1 Tax=Leucobacter coleopterorum TaxID=2714933 RepID=A0ABX6JXA2_9MICO|nr:NADPH-dependent FMN reductase [Leucobacter coleopterorum]QIM18939.1 NAD(P)H-dependent oxidoreductase [Leucobacter coleopterorum]